MASSRPVIGSCHPTSMPSAGPVRCPGQLSKWPLALHQPESLGGSPAKTILHGSIGDIINNLHENLVMGTTTAAHLTHHHAPAISRSSQSPTHLQFHTTQTGNDDASIQQVHKTYRFGPSDHFSTTSPQGCLKPPRRMCEHRESLGLPLQLPSCPCDTASSTPAPIDRRISFRHGVMFSDRPSRNQPWPSRCLSFFNPAVRRTLHKATWSCSWQWPPLLNYQPVNFHRRSFPLKFHHLQNQPPLHTAAPPVFRK